MHSGRPPWLRGGKSAKRKKIRESFWNAVNPAAEVDSSGGLADSEEEIVEVVNEPVARQQAKAKALRLKSNPIDLLLGHLRWWMQYRKPECFFGITDCRFRRVFIIEHGCECTFRFEFFFRYGTTISGCGTCNRSSDLLQPPANLRELFEDLFSTVQSLTCLRR